MARQTHRYRALLLCLLMGAASNAWALPPSTPPLTLQWIDANGKVFAAAEPKQVNWTSTERSGFTEPALRLSLANPFPRDWTITSITPDAANLVQATGAEVIVDVRAARAALGIRFKDSKTKLHQLSLSIIADVSEPHIVIDQSCLHLDMNVEMPTKAEAHPLFASFACREQKEGVQLSVITSEESVCQKIGGPQPERASVFEIPNFSASKSTSESKQVLLKLKLTDGEGRSSDLTVVRHTNNWAAHQFSWSVATSATVYSYEEKKLGKLSETALVGKLAAGYLLAANIDLSANAFATLVPLSHSPTAFASARFFGLNARVGYKLPVRWWGLNYAVSPGWYHWGMLTGTETGARSNFGMQSMSGPQLYLLLSKPRNTGERSFWSYFKYALISDGSFSQPTRNAEFALGGGYDLTRGEKPFSVTLDFAQTSFYTPTNWMKLLSASLGIQKQF